MKTKMPKGGPKWDGVIVPGSQKECGASMREYLNSQLWIPPIDESQIWVDNEEE